MPHKLNDAIRLQIDEAKSKMRVIDDQARPLTGSDIHGSGTEQYTRLAHVGYKPSKGPERFFVLIAESSWLYNKLHDKLQTPEFIRDGFDNNWMFIEEVLFKPTAATNMNQYLAKIPATEAHLWVAANEYLQEQGAFGKARAFIGKVQIQ